MNNVNAQYSPNTHFGAQQFNGPINPNGVDLSQYQQQRLADGNPNSQSPGLQHTPFQVPQVVPAKRSRPGEDNAGGLPQLGPGSHNRSRSQTPQQPHYPPFSGQPPNQQFHTPTSMQQMPTTMSPSPASQQQPYRQPGMGPYGQIQQMNRMGTPQDRMGMPNNAAQQAFMRQNLQAPGQGIPGMGGQNTAGSPQANMNNLQMQEVMRRRYQAHLAQTQQQLHNAPQPGQGGMQSAMSDPQRTPWGHAANGQAPNRPPISQASDHGLVDKAQEQAFIRSLKNFHEQRQGHLNMEPRVCGHPISYFRLFRRYAEVNPGTSPQAWAAVAAGLGLPQDQDQNIIRELRMIFERDLQAFYFLYFKAMRDRKLKITAGQPQSGDMMKQHGSPQQGVNGLPLASSPPSAPAQQSQPNFPQGPLPNTQNNLSNDDLAKQTTGEQKVAAGVNAALDTNGDRKSASLFSQIGNADPQVTDPNPRPASAVQANLASQRMTPVNGLLPGQDETPASAVGDRTDPVYSPRRRQITTYGGIDIDSIDYAGSRLHDLKAFPRYEELGVVDLHVINLCLQSRFEAELTYALNQLAAVSQRPLILARCEDLLDTLVDYGEEQVQILLEDTSSDNETGRLRSFDELTKASLLEVEAVQNDPAFGEATYQRERAIERLLAITTILRNLSFPVHEPPLPDRDVETNSKVLTSTNVKGLLVSVVKTLASGPSCLRTARHAQDIMKDLITFCSNTADSLEFSCEDEARSFLQLLVAFAPSSPATPDSGLLRFTSFDPAHHHYLPCAVDSLAKLLARDDPNRNLCRSIFMAESSSSSHRTTNSLITQAFALAVAPIPDGLGGTFNTVTATNLAGRRRPLLSQGMLAADILSTLVPPAAYMTAPGSHGKQSLERNWLESEDAWASRLMRLVVAMAMSDSQGNIQRDPMTQTVIDDSSRGFVSITQRSLSMLRRLVDRSDKWEANNGGGTSRSASLTLFGAVPLDEVLFSAVSIPRFDMETMKGLTALANLSKGS